ncbi:hypothetical protein C3E97_007890 [Pseudomonas sp. MWU12-2115]|nr:hypothetical protein C3E97_007890 [Pseudomonas sp. MWU12-2115]
MRRRFPSTCIASRSARARGCRRRFSGWLRKCLRPDFFSAHAGLFASKPAPTGDSVHNTNPMWERACSRRRQTRQHMT